MPRMNTQKKLEWIHMAIQEAMQGNVLDLAAALKLVEGIQRRYFHASTKPYTFGALQATEKVISLIDMRKTSGEGTMGMANQIAEIIDREIRSQAKTLALDDIANDAEKWLDADDDDAGVEPVDAGVLMTYIAETARKALNGETTPATPPAPELVDSLKKMVAMARHAPLVGHEYDGSDIDEAEVQIAKAEKA